MLKREEVNRGIEQRHEPMSLTNVEIIMHKLFPLEHRQLSIHGPLKSNQNMDRLPNASLSKQNDCGLSQSPSNGSLILQQ